MGRTARSVGVVAALAVVLLAAWPADADEPREQPPSWEMSTYGGVAFPATNPFGGLDESLVDPGATASATVGYSLGASLLWRVLANWGFGLLIETSRFPYEATPIQGSGFSDLQGHLRSTFIAALAQFYLLSDSAVLPYLQVGIGVAGLEPNPAFPGCSYPSAVGPALGIGADYKMMQELRIGAAAVEHPASRGWNCSGEGAYSPPSVFHLHGLRLKLTATLP